MIKLRPHHILCIQNYKGKGYSFEFTENMDRIVETLRHNTKQEIEIIFSKDDICDKCPNKQGNNLCTSDYKVRIIDNNVIKYLDLKEGVYRYDYILNLLKNNIDKNRFKYICGQCEWYKKGICTDIV